MGQRGAVIGGRAEHEAGDARPRGRGADGRLPPAPEDPVPSGLYALSERLGGIQRVDGFFLDRYPVTVERYARFVEAGGYRDRAWWDDEAWAWRSSEGIEAPRFWDDPGWPLWRRFLRPSRPVVGVSWYEACAFSAFEGRRLPSAAEWVAAARGPEGWAFPWGEDWEDGRVAVRGVGPRCTWPVGFWPGSRGPFGHHDLVGNVWQWTEDEGEPGPGRRAGARRVAAVRGGSWASRPEQNRTDHWNAYARDGRHSHVGFRTVALVPPRDPDL